MLHSCVEVCELIKLSFGVVSVGGPGIGILDGVNMLQGEGCQCIVGFGVSLAFRRYSQVLGHWWGL